MAEVRCFQKKTEEQTPKNRASSKVISFSSNPFNSLSSRQQRASYFNQVKEYNITHKELENVYPIPKENDDTAASPCVNENCKKYTRSLELECEGLRTKNLLLKEKIHRTALNDKKVNILTGLQTYSLLMTLFHVVAPYLMPKSSLTVFQQYMLTLMKLRMNFS